jgi:heat shock protein 1/8
LICFCFCCRQLETFAYSLKHSVEDEKTADKFSPTDRNTVLDAVREVESWIQEKGDTAEKEEFEVRHAHARTVDDDFRCGSSY